MELARPSSQEPTYCQDRVQGVCVDGVNLAMVGVCAPRKSANGIHQEFPWLNIYSPPLHLRHQTLPDGTHHMPFSHLVPPISPSSLNACTLPRATVNSQKTSLLQKIRHILQKRIFHDEAPPAAPRSPLSMLLVKLCLQSRFQLQARHMPFPAKKLSGPPPRPLPTSHTKCDHGIFPPPAHPGSCQGAPYG